MSRLPLFFSCYALIKRQTLMLARQVRGAVREPERDPLHGEVGELNRLFEHDRSVTIFAEKSCRAVVVDRQGPYLKLFAGHRSLVALRQSNFVKQPICSALVGDVFYTVGKEHIAIETMAIPVFAAGKVAKVRLCVRVRFDIRNAADRDTEARTVRRCYALRIVVNS